MKYLLGVLILAVLVSCTSSLVSPEAPDDLIPRDSMVIVLKELVVIESYVQTRFQRVDGYYKVMRASGKACLKRCHISPQRFDSSYSWYVTEQDQLRQIYVQVREELAREVNKLGPMPVSPPTPSTEPVAQPTRPVPFGRRTAN